MLIFLVPNYVLWRFEQFLSGRKPQLELPDLNFKSLPFLWPFEVLKRIVAFHRGSEYLAVGLTLVDE